MDNLTQTPIIPTGSSPWWESCIKAFSDERRYSPIHHPMPSGGVLLAPLVCKRWWLPLYELAGASALREPVALPVTRPSDGRTSQSDAQISQSDAQILPDVGKYRDLFKALLEMNRPLHLGRFPVNSHEVAALEEILTGRDTAPMAAEKRRKIHNPNRFKILREVHRIPHAGMARNWDSFEKTVISSSRRSSFRRLKKKLEEKGTLRVRVERPTPTNVSEHIEELFRVEQSGWKGRAGTSILDSPATTSFFRDLGWRMAHEGALTMFFLELEEKTKPGTSNKNPESHTLAAQYAVTWGNRLWILKIGHDEQWSWASPGILLMNEVVRQCHLDGLESCEFMGNDDTWLQIWATGHHELISYRIYPKTLLGQTARSINRIITIINDFSHSKSKK